MMTQNPKAKPDSDETEHGAASPESKTSSRTTHDDFTHKWRIRSESTDVSQNHRRPQNKQNTIKKLQSLIEYDL